jgi:hypothetical protein
VTGGSVGAEVGGSVGGEVGGSVGGSVEGGSVGASVGIASHLYFFHLFLLTVFLDVRFFHLHFPVLLHLQKSLVLVLPSFRPKLW